MSNFLPKIIKKIPKKKVIFFFVVDALLIALAVFLAFFLRFDYQIPPEYFPTIKGVIFLALIFCLPIFYFLKLYSFSWSYISMGELISLAKAASISFLFIAISVYLSKDYYSFHNFPRSTLLISYILVFLFCGGIRLSKRIYLQIFKKGTEKKKKRTLIVGAGDAGEQILRSILNLRDTVYLPLGFADDSSLKQGSRIHGLKILGKINEIPEIIRENRIEELIIALPSAGSETIKRAVGLGRKTGLRKIRIVPPIGEIINGETSFRNLREIQVEDLLGRDPVLLDTESIRSSISNKVILITGAAGSIGSELSRQVAKFKPSLLLLLDQDETGIFNISEKLEDRFPSLRINALIANIKDKEKLNHIFREFKPNIVFHAAAYKHVPLMEEHSEEAVKNNIFGTEIIAKTALNFRAEKFISISTDKAVNPISIMGATKRIGEMICQYLNQKNNTKFISVRFGNVLDSRGSVIPIFKKQIEKGGPIEVTHSKMKRYFMTTAEACLLVMQAGTMGRGGEVFVLDMGKPISILDLAKEMIRLSGFEADKDIPIVFTGPRPGEKFFEEILTAEEGTIATQNQKIFIAKLSRVDEQKLENGLKRLREAIKEPNKEEIISILRSLIPFYGPHNTV